MFMFLKMVEFKELGEKARKVLEENVGKKALNIIGMREEAGKHIATVQILERKAVPDSQDLIGIYEVSISKEGKVLGFERIAARHRVMPYGQEVKEKE